MEGKGRLVKLARFSFSFRTKIGGAGQCGFSLAVITKLLAIVPSIAESKLATSRPFCLSERG